MGRHGGGAFSGKDPTKVIARAHMLQGMWQKYSCSRTCVRCEVQIAYAIGVASPVSVMIDTFGTGKIDDEKILKIVNEHFDLRPDAIIRDLKLRRPIYRKTAAYGHFGREDEDFTWEKTDKAESMRRAAGI